MTTTNPEVEPTDVHDLPGSGTDTATATTTSATAATGPATLGQVARLAGVSPATASRVLTGSARVSRAARIQVEEAVQRLGYVPRRRSAPDPDTAGAIAAVLCEDGSRVFSDPFFARVLWGVKRELDGRVPLVVLMVGKPEEWRMTADYLRGGHVSGVLLISSHRDDPATLVQAAAGAPVVLAGRPLSDIPLPYVDVDNRGGASSAVRHLLSVGRRTIGTIAGPADMGVGVDRLTGYRVAAEEAGMNVSGLIGHGDFTGLSGEHAMNRLLDRRPDLDAVLAASDLMAIGAMRALRRSGRRVPDDVAVIGFDDAPVAKQIRPRLSTVRQPIEDLGARLARELRAQIAGRPSCDRRVVLKTRLIVRDSG